MAGIMNKIGDALHIGGGQKKDEHKPEAHHGEAAHKVDDHHKTEHKEGFVEKIKDKIHGEGGAAGTHGHDGEEKKKKKDKKKKKEGHHDGHSSSSSDSD